MLQIFRLMVLESCLSIEIKNTDLRVFRFFAPKDAEKLNRTIPEQTRLEQIRPDKTRPDQTRQDQTRQDQTRPDQTRPHKTRQDQIDID